MKQFCRNVNKNWKKIIMPAHKISSIRYYHDITGFETAVQHSQNNTKIDDAIMNTISLQDDPTIYLMEILKVESNDLADILLIFNNLIQDQMVDNEFCMKTWFDKLNNRIPNQSLNPRVSTLIAASLAWYENNYSLAAAILDAYLTSNPLDVLILKLTQEAYIKSGDSSNIFSCVARRPEILSNSNHLIGYIYGMKSVGYLEIGRLKEAEACARQGLSLTNGKDTNSLQSILGCLQLTGCTPEVFEVTDRYSSTHENFGKLIIFYHNALSQIQRGNYGGASATFKELVEYLDSNPTKFPIKSFVYATLILWQLKLNSVDPKIQLLWKYHPYIRCWNRVANHTSTNNSLFEVCRTMALWHFNSLDDSANLSAETKPVVDSDVGLNGADTNVNKFVQKDKPTAARLDVFSWFGSRGVSTSKSATKLVDAAPIFTSCELHIDALTKRLRTCEDAQEGRIESVSPVLVNLKKLQAIVIQEFGLGWVEQGSTVECRHLRAGLLYSKAILAFLDHDYSSSSATLGELRATGLGGSEVDRQCVKYTLIESYLREGKYKEAQSLLLERILLAPSEAQSWRRLGSILGRMDQEELARMAHYTSWQLGIGQGGFGGPS